MTTILDGRALAEARAPALRDRVRRLAEKGSTPRLLLLAFATRNGRAPWIGGKVRACEDAGIEVTPLILPDTSVTDGARAALEKSLAGAEWDGVFVQFPFPVAVDGDALAASIPPELDIDVMAPGSVRAFLAGAGTRPPLTVAATLMLLEAHRIELAGRSGLVVGEPTPFNRMFREALGRKGAEVDLLPPDASDLHGRLDAVTLVVASAARPGTLRSGALASGSVVIDGGYFNPGKQGDVDVSDGIEHLEALAPVPGGVGPVTVSALVNAVIERGEARGNGS